MSESAQAHPPLLIPAGRTTAMLVLSDGSVFQGISMGASGRAIGEVVFNTGMSGYQEVLTDPSYRGQLVTFTSPHIGNYGVTAEDGESQALQARGAIVRDLARRPSNHRAKIGFEEWLKAEGVVGIAEVDTRSLTRRLRDGGVTMGIIAHGATPEDVPELMRELLAAPAYESVDFVDQVASRSAQVVTSTGPDPFQGELRREPVNDVTSPTLGSLGRHVAVIDFGVKENILRHLLARGAGVSLWPRTVTLDELTSFGAHGVLFSNGPGDPRNMAKYSEEIGRISQGIPTFGICLGHQMIAQAFGGETFKLQFGHRGPNQPVGPVGGGGVAITSQNHGYAVREETFPGELEITEKNLNDGTVAAFRHRDLPILAVQYHPEAGPGPADATPVFDRFLALL